MSKIKAKFRRPSASEQLVLEHFQLRLLTEPAELSRCDALIACPTTGSRAGPPVALVETFVDPECFRGATYQVSGWSELGPTSGFGRHAQRTELVSAIGGQTRRWLGGVRVAAHILGMCRRLVVGCACEWLRKAKGTRKNCRKSTRDFQDHLTAHARACAFALVTAINPSAWLPS